MARGFTSQMARNIFYGGSLFFVLLFAVLILDTERKIPERSKAAEITRRRVAGAGAERDGERCGGEKLDLHGASPVANCCARGSAVCGRGTSVAAVGYCAGSGH